MRLFLLSSFLVVLGLQTTFAAGSFVDSREIENSRDCIFKLMMKHMNKPIDANRPLPRIRTQSETPLSEFQDSMEVLWKFRPEVFTNAFQPFRNEIFILNEKAFYEEHKRSVYDSLAHELTHYFQYAYQNADFTVDDEGLEWHAVDIQTWFRETYRSQFQGDRFICP